MATAAKRTPEDEERIEREFMGEAPPDEPEMEAPQEPILFRSKGANFRAVMVARNRWTAPNGEVGVVAMGRYAQDFPRGHTIEFAPNGEYVTADPREIEYLRSLPTFNLEFWQVGAEPHAVPNPKPVMDKVVSATLSLDDDELARLEEQERNSWNREFVLDSIRSARERVQGAVAAAKERGA